MLKLMLFRVRAQSLIGEPLRDIAVTNAGVIALSVFVTRLPPLRSPTVPHADAAVILPYC
jgi:hypothetical protein